MITVITPNKQKIRGEFYDWESICLAVDIFSGWFDVGDESWFIENRKPRVRLLKKETYWWHDLTGDVSSGMEVLSSMTKEDTERRLKLLAFF